LSQRCNLDAQGEQTQAPGPEPLGETFTGRRKAQGRQDSNLQPAVLEPYPVWLNRATFGACAPSVRASRDRHDLASAGAGEILVEARGVLGELLAEIAAQLPEIRETDR
jgi:hypothetical protein